MAYVIEKDVDFTVKANEILAEKYPSVLTALSEAKKNIFIDAQAQGRYELAGILRAAGYGVVLMEHTYIYVTKPTFYENIRLGNPFISVGAV